MAYAVDLKTFGPVLMLLFQELIVGAVLGLTGATGDFRLAGYRAPSSPSSLGLGFVTAVDPTQNQQGMLVGNFLAVSASR